MVHRCRHWVSAVAWISVLALGGCGGGIISSIEEVTTSTHLLATFVPPEQARIASVPGMLPCVAPGMMAHHSKWRLPSTTIGLSDGKSFVVTTQWDYGGDLDELYRLRTDLLKLRLAALKVVAARIHLTTVLFSKELKDAGLSDPDDRSRAERSYEEAKDQYEKLYNRVAAALKHEGVFVYRWTTESSAAFGGVAGGLLHGRVDGREQRSGFAIVAGLRLSTLYVGNDFQETWNRLGLSGACTSHLKVVTYMVQAQHILYVSESEFEARLRARINASYNQLRDLPATIRNLDQIELETIASTLSNLSNMGMFGHAKHHVSPVLWMQGDNETTADKISASLKKMTPKANNWQTFYMVETKLRDLLQVVRHTKSRKTSREDSSTGKTESRILSWESCPPPPVGQDAQEAMAPSRSEYVQKEDPSAEAL